MFTHRMGRWEGESVGGFGGVGMFGLLLTTTGKLEAFFFFFFTGNFGFF